MTKWTVFGRWLVAVCPLVWSQPGLAAGKSRFHLGLETAIVNSTATETTRSVTLDGTTTDTKYVSSSTQYGLPGPQALSLGVAISDKVDIGVKFGYSNTATKLGDDATATEVSYDELAISPYVAYLSGSRGSKFRFTAGGLVGYGAGNTTYSTPSGATSAPAASKTSSLTATQYGVLIGARLHASDLLSIDPIATLTSTSTMLSGTATSTDVEMSGVSFMLNVGFSLWFGGGPQEVPAPLPAPQAWKPPQPPVAGGMPAPSATPSAPAQLTMTPPALSVPTASTPVLSPGVTNTPPDGLPSSAPAASVVAPTPEKPSRLTLSLGEGRTALLLLKSVGPTPSIGVVLRESRVDTNLTNCKQLVLNAPYQPELAIFAVLARGITTQGPVPVLKAEVAVEQLQMMAASPATDVDGVSDHWIDVCGRLWHLGESERARLKTFLDASGTRTSAP